MTPPNPFSERGAPLTDLERQLIADSCVDCPESMSDLWIVIAQRIGIDNLVVLFDEVGGEKVHVPTRKEFFAALWRPVLASQLRKMRNETGASLERMGEAFGISKHAVARALRGQVTPQDDE